MQSHAENCKCSGCLQREARYKRWKAAPPVFGEFYAVGSEYRQPIRVPIATDSNPHDHEGRRNGGRTFRSYLISFYPGEGMVDVSGVGCFWTMLGAMEYIALDCGYGPGEFLGWLLIDFGYVPRRMAQPIVGRIRLECDLRQAQESGEIGLISDQNG